MERVTHSTRAVDLFGAGKDGYTDGVPAVTAATVLNSAAMNQIQEELANVVENNDTALDGGNTQQVYESILRMVTRQAERIGVSQSTIVSASSGAAGMDAWVDSNGALQRLCVVGGSATISTLIENGYEMEARTPGSSYAGNFTGCVATPSGYFVIVGEDGEIQRSTDGVTFTRRNTAAGQSLTCVASNGASTVVAMGIGSSAWISVDEGDTWSSYTQPDSTITLIKFAAGLFVVVEATGKVYTSPTGANGTWTLRFTATGTSPSSGLGYRALTYSPQLGFAFDVIHNTGPARSVCYSADGITWAQTPQYSQYPTPGSGGVVGHVNVGYTPVRIFSQFTGDLHIDVHILESYENPVVVASAPLVLTNLYALRASVFGGRLWMNTYDGADAYMTVSPLLK